MKEGCPKRPREMKTLFQKGNRISGLTRKTRKTSVRRVMTGSLTFRIELPFPNPRGLATTSAARPATRRIRCFIVHK